MSEGTKIQWADDTANFWRGCTKVSAGCANCYAEKNIGVKMAGIRWGKGAPRIKSKSAVADCLRWNKKPWVCKCGSLFQTPALHDCSAGRYDFPWGERMHRRRVFSLSLGDWLDPEVPVAWLAEMLDTIRRCDQLQFILCTKRPELWRQRLIAAFEFTVDKNLQTWIWAWLVGADIPPQIPKNIILLASVENQQAADERIPALLQIPAVCRGLSLEPLLGPVELNLRSDVFNENALRCDKINWLIIGGESGPNARPCNVDWIRSLVQQGKAAGVATFVKQLGTAPVLANDSDDQCWPGATIPFHEKYQPTHQGGIAPLHLRDKKGGDPSEWPQDLRVQEFP